MGLSRKHRHKLVSVLLPGLLLLNTPTLHASPPPDTTAPTVSAPDSIEDPLDLSAIPPISPLWQDQTPLIDAYETAWLLWDDAVKKEATAGADLQVAKAAHAAAAAAELDVSKSIDGLLQTSRYRAAASYVFSPSSQSSPIASPSSSDAILSSMVRQDSVTYSALSREMEAAQRSLFEATQNLAHLERVYLSAQENLSLRKSRLAITRAELLSFQRNVELASDGCPTTAPSGTLSATAELIGIYQLCVDSVVAAPSKEAAQAIKYALSQLGSPYTKVARMQDGMYDCSSLVMRSYEHAGARTVSRGGRGWAPTTWVIRQAPWTVTVSPLDAKPGDLVFPHPGHVSMLLAHGQMVHTSTLSKPARVQDSYKTIYVIKRVLPWYLQDEFSDVPNPWTTWTPPSDLSTPFPAPSDEPTGDFIEPILESPTDIVR